MVNSMFISLCGFIVMSNYDEMNHNLVFRIFTMYFEVQILVICNNHESRIGMNNSVTFVET
jgi:hypothetical protein